MLFDLCPLCTLLCWMRQVETPAAWSAEITKNRRRSGYKASVMPTVRAGRAHGGRHGQCCHKCAHAYGPAWQRRARHCHRWHGQPCRRAAGRYRWSFAAFFLRRLASAASTVAGPAFARACTGTFPHVSCKLHEIASGCRCRALPLSIPIPAEQKSACVARSLIMAAAAGMT